MPTAPSSTSFETLSKPTTDDALDRLMHAARMASDNPIDDSIRWHGWFAWQTGVSLPLDLFTKLAQSLDYLGYCEVFDLEGVPEAEAAVDHYRLFLNSMVIDRLGPRKAGR